MSHPTNQGNPAPIFPFDTTKDNAGSQDSQTTDGQGTQDRDGPGKQGHGAQYGAESVGEPVPAPAPPVTRPRLNLGFDVGFAPDPGAALRAPDAGSQPSVVPFANTATPAATVAEDSPDRWGFLRTSATGQWLFLSGFLLLLLSIGGLVTVGIYRRRW